MPAAPQDKLLPQVVDEFLMLVQETAEFDAREDVKNTLAEARNILVNLRRRLQLAKHRYVVGVVGLSNVGKSTLLNALLGCDLAPCRNGPCTAAPIEFRYGPSIELTAYQYQGLNRPRWRFNDLEGVHQRLALLAEDSGAEKSQLIGRVVVDIPNPLLQGGLVIADTPGFGAAQLNGADGSHELALKQYLQTDVSQVFWIVLADQGIGKREMSFHDQFFAEICDDVIVTGSENWSDKYREKFREKYANGFGQKLPRFHFVSGLDGLKARATDDAERLETAGIPMLEARIRELSNVSGRSAAIEDRLLRLAEDLRYWITEFSSQTEQFRPYRWRPDSWSRWLAFSRRSIFGRQLTERLELPE